MFFIYQNRMGVTWLVFNCIRNNRGQTLVEFAIILPVLLLLVVGMMEFGLVINQYMVVAEAAREGARSAALGGTDANVISTSKNAASQIDKGELEVSITPPVRTRGSSVTVTVTNPVNTITSLMKPFFPSGFKVNGSAVMRVE